jgi:DedD protein
VLFVVIVLPIVLDQEPRPVQHDLTVQIPSQDGGKFGSRVLQKLEAAKAADKSATVPVPSPDAAKPEPAPSAAPAAKTDAAEPKAGAPTKKAEQAAKKADEAKRALALLNDESYVVPLGTFANMDNAKQAQDKASAAGFKTYTEKIAAKEGEQTRVRAGPFDSRESAEHAREKLKALGFSVGQVAQR